MACVFPTASSGGTNNISLAVGMPITVFLLESTLGQDSTSFLDVFQQYHPRPCPINSTGNPHQPGLMALHNQQ